jgi:hypothetical protein
LTTLRGPAKLATVNKAMKGEKGFITLKQENNSYDVTAPFIRIQEL